MRGHHRAKLGGDGIGASRTTPRAEGTGKSKATPGARQRLVARDGATSPVSGELTKSTPGSVTPETAGQRAGSPDHEVASQVRISNSNAVSHGRSSDCEALSQDRITDRGVVSHVRKSV